MALLNGARQHGQHGATLFVLEQEVSFNGDPAGCLEFSPSMRVGVPRETAAGERRVALVPDAVARLRPIGIEIVVEAGAGDAAAFADDEYREAGAAIGDPWAADVIAKVQKPSSEEVERLREGQVLIGFLEPLTDTAGVERLASRGVVAFAMESIPRITRAQPMDALSSQATVSGYKAVLLAAGRFPRFFPMLMTAVTVLPAKTLVLGAGVAGLQAIATAHRLGAVVVGFDVRPVVREQVESSVRSSSTSASSARRPRAAMHAS